jgi:hypothetical protein
VTVVETPPMSVSSQRNVTSSPVSESACTEARVASVSRQRSVISDASMNARRMMRPV